MWVHSRYLCHRALSSSRQQSQAAQAASSFVRPCAACPRPRTPPARLPAKPVAGLTAAFGCDVWFAEAVASTFFRRLIRESLGSISLKLNWAMHTVKHQGLF